MITYARNRPLQRIYTCDACGELISEGGEVLLMRDPCALPQDMETFQVHRRCVETFLKQHMGRWRRIALSSEEARWFV